MLRHMLLKVTESLMPPIIIRQRVGANPRAAQHTSGTPVHTEELAERGNERSIGYRTCCWAAKGAGKGLRAA